MINKNSIKEVESSSYGELRIPLYDSYCFSNILGTIKSLFNIDTINSLPIDVIGKKNISSNKVVFFLIDAFGWSFYEKYKKYSKFLLDIEKEGVVSKLTSQFPSTTTAHVTTALSGIPVYEHGLYEWFYYEKEADDIITAFLFKEARNNKNQSLKDRNINPKSFLPDSIFKEFNKFKIKSTVYQPSYINNGEYTKTMCEGARLKGYEKYDDLFSNLAKDLYKNNNKEYYYVYLPEIDSVAHEFGWKSKEFNDELIKLLNSFDNFYENIKKVNDISIIISADHGQIETDLNNKNYLNEILPEIKKYLKKNKNGDFMSPGGYCRDLFLMVEDKYLDRAKNIIKEKLKDSVYIFTYDELINIGFFKEDSKRLKDRCGNLIIIPKGNDNIWWYEKDIFEVFLKGVHGGLSPFEMEIPFLYYRKEK